jgi:hypothetical protein
MSEAALEDRTESKATPPQSTLTPPVPQRAGVDDTSIAAASYANFCRVTGTPEELIIDFGLNSQPFGTAADPVKVTQRIVTNFYTAKRLLHALHLSVQRHEQAFGVLETDVNKRVVKKQRQRQTTAAD